MKGRLRSFDLLCLGVNGIVGSGIFLIPGRLAAEAGPASLLLFPICGLLFVAVGLCFAEASSRIDNNGGPYQYVRLAFGDLAGFSTGWMAVITAILSYAAVARGLPYYADSFVPGIGQGWPAHSVSAGLIVIFAIINIRGIRLGAYVTNLFTIGKLIPLFLLLLAGLWALPKSSASLTPFAPHGFHPLAGLLLAVAFTYQGFEAVPIPAGESQNARKMVPRAVIGSLIISALLYTALYTVLMASGAPIAGSDQPLAAAALSLMGPTGGRLVALGAIISMTGFCAGGALLTPRYLTVLCTDGFLPSIGGRYHPRLGTPVVAIILTSAITIILSMTLDFDRLVDISALAVITQYLGTCISIPRLRRLIPDDSTTYRIPGGWLCPALGTFISLAFLAQIHKSELGGALLVLLLGIAVSSGYRKFFCNSKGHG